MIVFSHLRWDFVFQRPQHLLTRDTKHYDVFYIEEPIFEGESTSFREFDRAAGVKIIQPILPRGSCAADAIFHQGDVAEAIVARAGGRRVLVWYYRPMALEFGHRIDESLPVAGRASKLDDQAAA